MFLNLSNHPSDSWSSKQIEAAEKWGKIQDYPFPPVSPHATEEDIKSLADQIYEEIRMMNPAAVMCQGEFTLTYALVSRLKEKGIPVLAACSERKAVEKILPNGTSNKIVEYEFCGFREYR